MRVPCEAAAVQIGRERVHVGTGTHFEAVARGVLGHRYKDELSTRASPVTQEASLEQCWGHGIAVVPCFYSAEFIGHVDVIGYCFPHIVSLQHCQIPDIRKLDRPKRLKAV